MGAVDRLLELTEFDRPLFVSEVPRVLFPHSVDAVIEPVLLKSREDSMNRHEVSQVYQVDERHRRVGNLPPTAQLLEREPPLRSHDIETKLKVKRLFEEVS